jgi:hypothetical protein
MHQTYGFLMELSQPNDANPGIDLVNRAVEQFEQYMDDFGDMNNYGTPFQLITFDDRVYNACHREDFQYGQDITSSDPMTFEGARRHALNQLIRDSHAYETITRWSDGRTAAERAAWLQLHNMTVEEVVMDIEIKLSTALTCSHRNKVIAGKQDFPPNYKRRVMNRHLGCLEESFYPPFTYQRCPPYEYRNFDLRMDPEQKVGPGCAILLADIHV